MTEAQRHHHRVGRPAWVGPVIHYMRDVDGSRSWQVAGRWGALWSPRGRQRLFSERNGLAPSGWRDVRVGRTAELSFARLRR
jgi:hypothetical protein